jgi:TPR repeat protein
LSTLKSDLPRLGLRLLDARVDGNGEGALVATVSRGGPAFLSGVRSGDVIRSIDGVLVSDRSGLVDELRRRSLARTVRLEVLREGRSLAFTTQPGKGAEIFAKGCDKGYMEDCVSLGMAYERAEGVPVDLARAVALYRRACEAGESSGCVNLGLGHERGAGVVVDFARASRLYEQVCSNGDVWACSNLGALRARGVPGVAKDERGAAQMFSRACEGGLPEACANHQVMNIHAGGLEGASLTTPARPYTR